MIDQTRVAATAAPAAATRQRAPYRLQTKVTLVVVLLVLASLAISALVGIAAARRDLRRQIERQQIAEAERAAAELGEHLRRAREVVEDMAQRIGSAELADLRRLENTVLADSGAPHFFSDVLLLDAALTARADRPTLPNRRGTSYADRPHLQRALASGDTVLSAPFVGRVTGQPSISITAPVIDTTGRTVALVNGTMSLLQIPLLRELGSRDPQRETAFLVADADNRVVVHFAPDRLLTPVREQAVRDVIDAARQSRHTVTREATSTSAESTLYSAAPVPQTRWVVVAGTRTALAFAPLEQLEARLLAGLAVAMLLSACMTWSVLRWQLAPLRHLHEDVERLGSSPEAARLAVDHARWRSREIVDLAAAFARLIEQAWERGDEAARARTLVERVFDNTPDWIVVKDTQRRFVLANRAFCQALQLDEAALRGRTWSEVAAERSLHELADDDEAHGRADDERALAGETFVAPVRTWRRGDGVEHAIRTLRAPLRDDDGSVYGVLAIGQDITALQEAERRLAAANRVLAELAEEPGDRPAALEGLLAMLVDGASFGVAVYDATGACVYANESLARLRGTAPAVLRAENLHASAFWRDSGLARLADRVVEGATPAVHEVQVVDAAGRELCIACWLSPLGHSDRSYVVLVAHDLTAHKQRESRLAAARDRAEADARAKTVFLAHMSHELRTPLNAMLGFGQLLETDSLTRRQGEPFAAVQRAGLQLQSLLDELLDISRIEAGDLALACEPVDLAAALRDAAAMARAALERSGVSLDHELPEEACFVLADPKRLRQVIARLLSTALRFNTEAKPMTARIERTGARVRLSLIAGGPAIPAETLARLFAPLERLGVADAAPPGSGIGLSLSKRLVELMDGSIGASREEGHGTRFWTEFAACEPRAMLADVPVGTAAGLEGIGPVTVLYIEDNLANQRVIASLLARMPGLMLVTATTGRAGVNAARETLPHVILLDIQLPDIDGYAVLAELRADPLTRSIPVIALTAAAMPHDVRRAESARFAGYLTKPVELDTLVETLRATLARPGAR